MVDGADALHLVGEQLILLVEEEDSEFPVSRSNPFLRRIAFARRSSIQNNSAFLSHLGGAARSFCEK
jgi:hypothetical protein